MLGLRSWLLFGALLVPLPALAEMQVIWPQGWEVSRSPVDAAADAPVIRQRGVRLAEDGSQDLVMEVTRSRLGSGVRVSAENVIVEMRKALQKDFMRQGFQALAASRWIPCLVVWRVWRCIAGSARTALKCSSRPCRWRWVMVRPIH